MKSNSTILIFAPNLYPCSTGGIELFHYYFAEKLSETYQVLLLTNCDKISSADSLEVFSYPSKIFGNATFSKWFYQFRFVYKNRKKISLIHLPYSSKQLFQDYHVILFKILFKIPYILRIHGGGMHPSRPHFMHQILFDHAAGIMAVSSPIRAEYEKRHGKPITMIPSMLPFKRSGESKQVLKKKYGCPPTDTVVLFLGRIHKIKGTHILLKAFENLGMDYIIKNNLQLFFAGDGPFMVTLTKLRNVSDVKSRVKLLGRVPHEKVHELYKLADIFVIPSFMEARPLTLSEAFFNGTPAIGSDISTIANIICNNQTGLLFKKGDAEHLAQKIKYLTENDVLKEQFSRRSREQYRESYSYDSMLNAYTKFYDKILNRTETC